MDKTTMKQKERPGVTGKFRIRSRPVNDGTVPGVLKMRATLKSMAAHGLGGVMNAGRVMPHTHPSRRQRSVPVGRFEPLSPFILKLAVL